MKQENNKDSINELKELIKREITYNKRAKWYNLQPLLQELLWDDYQFMSRLELNKILEKICEEMPEITLCNYSQVRYDEIEKENKI